MIGTSRSAWDGVAAFCDIACVAWPEDYEIATDGDNYVSARQAAARARMAKRHEGFRINTILETRAWELREQVGELSTALDKLIDKARGR